MCVNTYISWIYLYIYDVCVDIHSHTHTHTRWFKGNLLSDIYIYIYKYVIEWCNIYKELCVCTHTYVPWTYMHLLYMFIHTHAHTHTNINSSLLIFWWCSKLFCHCHQIAIVKQVLVCVFKILGYEWWYNFSGWYLTLLFLVLSSRA